jgi:hypothetical protein
MTNGAHSTIIEVASEQIENGWVDVIDCVIFSHLWMCCAEPADLSARVF